MRRLTCSIEIGGLEALTFVSEVSIESSWQTLTDTCTIRLPRKALVSKARSLPDAIKVGNPVKVRYGYDGDLRTEFAGYVVGVKTGPPAEIQCQDEMYLLKRKPLTHAWASVSLQTVLEYIRQHSGLSFEIQTLGETDLGKFTINQATGAQVLDSLRKDYGIRCWFRGGVLIAGDPYQAKGKATVHLLTFRQNVVSDDLLYTRAEDIRLKVRAFSHVPGKRKGSRHLLKAESGDQLDGELRTLHFVGVQQKDLQARADAEIARLRFDGYRGTVTSFGVPAVEHGDVVEIRDPDYPERAGQFSVDKVSKSFGTRGSRRVITLGPKA
ncbi:MAG: hypothetical protein EOO63_05165 [Hymenobacter sp.]|nr:MAG: hypothetical protein EOO63_05165 [Hymenobacter sp.]